MTLFLHDSDSPLLPACLQVLPSLRFSRLIYRASGIEDCELRWESPMVSWSTALVSQVHEDTGPYREAASLASQGTSFTVVLDTHTVFLYCWMLCIKWQS